MKIVIVFAGFEIERRRAGDRMAKKQLRTWVRLSHRDFLRYA